MNPWLPDDRDWFLGLSRSEANYEQSSYPIMRPIRAFKLRILPRPRRKTYSTAGLANEVLHGRRINHTIIDPREKTRHLFKGLI